MTTYSTDPALYIFTSLTAGSSHIVTATSRLETILRANRVPFKAVDIATDEKARMLWGRRAGKDEGGRLRKLPGLVQEGLVLGDLVEIEDWNEYGELKQHVKIYYDEFTIPSINDKLPEPPKPRQPVVKAAPAAPPAPPAPEPKPAASESSAKPKADTQNKPDTPKPTALPIRSVADEAAQKAKELRLRTLREKVHGKKTDPDTEKATDKEASKNEKDASQPSISSEDGKPIGLQSPTSGTWKHGSTEDSLRDTLQSPTSAAWKSSSIDSGTSVSHRGSTIVAASEEEIKAIESASAIKEEPELEDKLAKADTQEKPKTNTKEDTDEDSDDDDDEEDDDEDEEDDDDDEDEDEDEDDDDDDDEDDEDEDSDDEDNSDEDDDDSDDDPKQAKPVAKEAPKEAPKEAAK